MNVHICPGVAEVLNFRMGGDAKAIFSAVHLLQMGLNLFNGKEGKGHPSTLNGAGFHTTVVIY